MKKSFFCFVLAILLLPAQAKVGYLLTVNSVNDFPAENYGGVNQQPERNAASWFETEYISKGKGDFITLSQMKSGIDVNTYSVLWVNVDRVGLASLAATGIDNSVVSAIKNYAAAGGKLYLTKQACMLAYSMGRIGYEPWFNNGGYTNGTDVWSINAMVGFGYTLYDHRSHAIYTGVTEEDAIDHYVFPMVGAVARTDNNNIWGDLMRKDGAVPTHYDNEDPQRLADFEGDWNCTVLGVWGHVADYCAAGVIEFYPQSGFGTIITNGFAAYQWGTSNDHIANVKLLTSNTLSYLQGETPQPPTPPVPPTPISDETKVKLSMNIVNGNKVKEEVTGSYININSRHTPFTCYGSKGEALRTDGYSTFMEMPLSNKGLSDQSLTFALTCAVQTYPMMVLDQAQNEWSYIAGNLNDDAKSGFAYCLSSQGDFRFECYAGGWKASSDVIKLPVNQWNHLVAVMDGTGRKLTLYNNGRQVGSVRNLSGSLNIGSTPMFIGKSNRNVEVNGLLLNTFNGLIDDIQIDNKAWSADDARNYTNSSAATPNFNTPDGYWKNDLYRPALHGMPSMNWTNETHGMTYSNGKYHVFFQKNGNGPYMSRLHWGHISSTDLFNWTEELIALYPLNSYDIKGCWSGAVFTDQTITMGKPWIVYTGVDNGHATIDFATPLDDNLIKWDKLASNPKIPNSPGGFEDFRDPYFFRNGNDAYVIVGTGSGGVSTTVLYKYNGGNWEFKGEFFRGANSGSYGTFFEMPNVTPMGGNQWLFTATPLNTADGVRTLYFVGTINSDGRFVPNDNRIRTFDLEGCNKHGYGLLSPTIFKKDGRTIAMGIVPDKLGTGDNIDMGWAHTYSLPREISIEGNEFVQKPVKEVENYRSESVKFSKNNFTLNGTQTLGEVKGRQLEVCATFRVASAEFGMRLLKSEFSSMKISFNPNTQILTVDMSGIPRKVNDGGVFNGRYSTLLPAAVRTGETFKLDVFLDHSILDIFINDKWATSIRVFPSDASSEKAEVYATGNTEVISLNAWKMESPVTGIGEVVWDDRNDDEEAAPFGYSNGNINYNLESETSVMVYDVAGRPLLYEKDLQGEGFVPFEHKGVFIVTTSAGKAYKLLAN